MSESAHLVRDFVNTFEPQVGTESLTSAWFAGRGLIPVGADLTPSELAAAISIREGIRSALLSAPADDLDEALTRIPVRASFGGGFHLVAVRDTPFDHAMAALIDAVRESRENQTWARLKVCARDTCHWAFYDSSRNQVRRWCSMAGCGTHVKNKRAYAVRKARP